MNQKIFYTGLTTTFLLLTSAFMLFPQNEVKAGESHLDYFDCKPSKERIEQIENTADFKEYLLSLDIPYSRDIAAEGETLKINKSYALNKCIVVYGTPNDVKAGEPYNQLWLSGQPLYLGYTEKGYPYPNPLYPDVNPSSDYVKDRDFVKNPWSDSALLKDIKMNPDNDVPRQISPSKLKPDYFDPKLGRVRTRAEELDRVTDRTYLKNCENDATYGCSLGKRGYFPKTNTFIKKTMVGSTLEDYANVTSFPNAYSVGIMSLQYYSTISNKWWFSSYYIPPYKSLFAESRDLSIKINSINPSSILEGHSYTVKYTVCNNGDTKVKNPVIHYGEASAKKSKTLSTTLKVGECYSGNIGGTAGSVPSDKQVTYVMEVNKNGKNPTDEENKANNKDTKNFTIINRVVDLSIGINSWTPTYPHSTEQVTINYYVCNNSNVPVNSINYKIGFVGSQVGKRISSLDEEECRSYSITQNTPIVKDYTGPKKLSGDLTSGLYFTEDVNSDNDHALATVTVRNPDVFTDIIVDNDNTSNQIGDAKVKVESRSWSSINQDCTRSSAACKSGTTKQKYEILVYDTKFTTSTADDVLVAKYNPSYNLSYGEKNYYTINRSLFTNWVKQHYPDTYQLVQFRITSQIPEYGKEVDWFGKANYENNRDEDIINYFPPRPAIAPAACNELEHQYSTYFTTPSGVNPIKICAGHYPTFPSTQVESGMQAYHYVLYRFFPQPIPKYTVITPETNDSNPNHFSQIYQLPTSENQTEMGDFQSMFFPNKTIDGYYQERGRYMPTGGTFNFEVYKKNEDDSKGQKIALGTVSYNIPSTCYDHYKLDINHQYACDEILFFLPNPDVASKKFEKPDSYNTSSDITYPISGTKIPYLNPGKYTFEFDANENFRYYYQTNLLDDGYKWKDPIFR